MKTVLKWNEKQKEIINSIFSEGYSKVLAEGGVGSGKSIAALWMIDFICQHTPGIIWLVGRKTYEAIKLDTLSILKTNPGILDASKGQWQDSSRQFQYTNGSLIYFRNLENADHLLGPTYGGIYVEQVELIKEEDYDLLTTRLRQFGQDSINTSKYMEHYKDYVDKKQLLPPKNYLFLSANPKSNWVKKRFIDREETEFKTIHLNTLDNKLNLPKNFINENASDAFKKRMYEGSWEALAGLIYPEFQEDNIVDTNFEEKFFKINIQNIKTYIIADPGYSISKFAILYAAILRDGRIYFFDEICKNGKNEEEMNKLTIPEIATLIKEKNKRWGIQPYGLIDYAANARTAGGTSVTQQFQNLGVLFNNCRKDDEFNTIMKIKQLLKEKRILINSRCANLITEFDLFAWDAKRADKPKDADNDFMDCIRYLINDYPMPNLINKNAPFWTAKSVMEGVGQELMNSRVNGNNTKEDIRIHERTALDYGI